MQEIQVPSLGGEDPMAIPWRRKWQPTPGFSPGESHGQRSLVGYSPQGCKEMQLKILTHTQTQKQIHYCFVCVVWFYFLSVLPKFD